ANMYETSIRTSNRTSYNRFYFRHYAAMEWLREQDESLFRTEVFNRKSKNDGMMWHVNTTTIFASSADSRTRSFYEAMGMGAAKGTYWYDGATPLTSAMLGVKYMIGEDDTMENALYKLLYSDGNGYLYECNYTLPMGYVVDLFLEDAWEIGDINSIATQNDLGHLLGIEEDLFTPVESVKESNQKYTITAKEDSYVYIYLGQNNVNKVKTTVGEKSKTYGQVSFDYLIPVGLIPSGETATVEEVDTEKGFSTFEAYEVNLDVLERILTELGEESLHIRSHGEGFIKGEVTLTEPGKLVVSIPMDEGWHIYVNGKETKPETFKDMFLAVTLEDGTYDIVLEYKTPGLMPGMVISVLALVAFFTCVVFEHRKKK
ncbi:MAG: YfhO family protein, partial [Lachnospiraceae bacterium]|nr:YfhO family protein [Lachnospiraceae bacterium]